MERSGPVIFVDADACPVKEEIVTVAGRHDLDVAFVANRGLRPSRNPSIRNVIVGAGADAADDWIAAEAAPADIVITQDIPLASRCIAKGALVVNPQGRIYASENIGQALASRNLHQFLREAGQMESHNAAFSDRDRSRFLQSLEQTVRRARKLAAYRSEK